MLPTSRLPSLNCNECFQYEIQLYTTSVGPMNPKSGRDLSDSLIFTPQGISKDVMTLPQ